MAENLTKKVVACVQASWVAWGRRLRDPIRAAVTPARRLLRPGDIPDNMFISGDVQTAKELHPQQLDAIV